MKRSDDTARPLARPVKSRGAAALRGARVSRGVAAGCGGAAAALRRRCGGVRSSCSRRVWVPHVVSAGSGPAPVPALRTDSRRARVLVSRLTDGEYAPRVGGRPLQTTHQPVLSAARIGQAPAPTPGYVRSRAATRGWSHDQPARTLASRCRGPATELRLPADRPTTLVTVILGAEAPALQALTQPPHHQ